jgi:hypothetical protein
MRNGEVEFLSYKCCFSDLKEQPGQNGVTQNTGTFLMSFIRIDLIVVEIWKGFSVFRIFPAVGFTAL